MTDDPRVMTLRLDQQTYDRLKLLAEVHRTSMNAEISVAIADHLARQLVSRPAQKSAQWD